MKRMPPAGKLALVEKEFSRIGLLLLHDRGLPSFTALVAGSPIQGSWWGHPAGDEIYGLLGEFERRSGSLSAKLVEGKVTYVHPRLWQAFLTLVLHGQPVRARKLSPLAQSLRKLVLRKGPVRVDELAPSGFATSRVLAPAVRELETAVLVRTDSVHTESGAHAKVLRSWSQWATAAAISPTGCSLEDARAELLKAADVLQHGSLRRRSVPLLDEGG